MEEPEEGKTYLRLTREDVEDITIGCNTAMHHILLALNPEFVGLAPFPPVIHHSLDIKARDLGLKINPSSYVFVLPNEAGFVGADNVGVLIAEEPYKSEDNQLIIDIGTNGELVLGNKHKLISSSCATGPALEGAQLQFGMRAAPGAIERIKIDPETHEVDYKVIGRDAWRAYSEPKDMKVKGICGSGILDVLAELYRAGVITKSGVFNKEQKSKRFRRNADTKQPEFVLAWAVESSIDKDIVITQKDVRQIQLAKGALYAGCKLMMHRMNLDKGGQSQNRRGVRDPRRSGKSPHHGVVSGLRNREDRIGGKRGRRRLPGGAPQSRETGGSQLGVAQRGIRRIDRGGQFPEGVHGGHAAAAHDGRVPSPRRSRGA